jgi:hypothetical protein
LAEIQHLPDVPLWSKFPHERLLERKLDDPRSFARGYQMRSYDDSERMFPSFESCRSHGVVLGEIARRGWPMFTGVDLATERRPGTVIFTLALDPATSRRYPVSVRAGRWSSPDTVSQLTAELTQFPQIQMVMVENNAYQQALVDWIRVLQVSRLWLKVESFTTTGHNKPNLEVGLPSLEAEFSKKAWVIPWDEYEHHEPGHRCGWCLWDLEMRNYPHHPTTDTVMAAWFSREAVSRWSGLAGAAAGGAKGDLNRR